MKIFLSWSGERSREVAQVFNDWLPTVLQAAKTWFSPEDIKVGKSWRDTVVTALEENNRGLLFLTHENASAAWVMFEAGALSKNIENSSVCPVLCGITPTDLIGPLSAFQAIRVVEREDVWKLIKDYNEHLGESRLEEPILLRSFERAWPELDKKVKEILGREIPKSTRKPQDIAEETLVLVRQIHQEIETKNNFKGQNSLLATTCESAYHLTRTLSSSVNSLSEEELGVFIPVLNQLQSSLSEMYEELTGEKLFPLKPRPQRDLQRKISNLEELVNSWPRVINILRKKLGTTIVAYLHDASPISMDGETITLGFTKSFHHSKAVDATQRLPFEQRISELLDKPRRLRLILIEE